MDVIQYILTEEDVLRLGPVRLDALAKCSTALVLIQIELYLKREEADPIVKAMVQTAYQEELSARAAKANKELVDVARYIPHMSYETVSATLQLSEIDALLSKVSKLRQAGDLKPYKSAVKFSTFDNFQKLLAEEGLTDIARRLYASRQVFCEPTNARAAGTAFKNVYFESEKLQVVENGLLFLKRMKEAGKAPESWRFL